jgi:hypothetical protein
VKSTEEAGFYRTTAGLNKTVVYQNRATMGVSGNKYTKNRELAYRNFIKMYYAGECNLDNRFATIAELVAFIKGFDDSFNPSPNSVTKLKTRGIAPRNVARIPVVLEFVEYVKKTFPDFDEEKFLTPVQ